MPIGSKNGAKNIGPRALDAALGFYTESPETFNNPLRCLSEWIGEDPEAGPWARFTGHLGVMRISGDQLPEPLCAGDMLLVDQSSCSPSPSGLFLLHDDFGFLPRRLEYVVGSSPERCRMTCGGNCQRCECRLDRLVILGRVVGRWQRL